MHNFDIKTKQRDIAKRVPIHSFLKTFLND